MPPKKSKQQKANVSADTYFLVRDEKTARCYVLAKDQLSYVKKIGLKIGSRVTFEGPDASSVRNAGVIVMTGTKDQCETSLSLIEKTNGSNKNESTEIDSDESNELAIDDRGEDESGTESNNMKHVNNDGTAVDVTKKPCAENNDKNNQTTNSSISTCTSEFFSSTTASATTSPCSTSLKSVDENSDVIDTYKETSNEYTVVRKNSKRTKISAGEYENLKQRVKQLEKKVERYETHWMPRPNNVAAAYFIEIGNVLSCDRGTLTDDEKSDKLEHICGVLNMSEEQLHSCEHKTDITKTCREIIRFLYPNPDERAKLLISTMDIAKLKAIQDYARMVHPAQSSLPNSTLNNAMGNVFAVEKRKREQVESEDEE